MLRHPFFKYSFVILLIICSSYTGAMILIHSASLTLSAVYVSLTWFVSFYWLPIWASAAIIFTCRKKGFSNTLFEWLLTVFLMATNGFFNGYWQYSHRSTVNIIVRNASKNGGVRYFKWAVMGLRDLLCLSSFRK